MSKFNQRTARPVARGPVTTTGPATTYEGGAAFSRDTKSDLVLLAVTNMVGEATFYESSGDRDNRFRDLVHAVAVLDPAWMAAFTNWLRTGANMRSASLVAGLEGAAALHGAGNTDGWARKLVSAPLQRADEVGEALGYWAAKYSTVKAGKPIHLPKPVKRGLADAALRLYNEYSALKYDTASKGARFADVITTEPDGTRVIDYALFHDLVPVEMPTPSDAGA